jgi:hypothetical protein
MTTPSEPGPYGGGGEVPAPGYQPPPPFSPPGSQPAQPPYGVPPGYPSYPPPGYAPQGYPPPGYPPPGYPPPGYPAGAWGPPASGTNGLAIASMVLGIVWIYWIGSILALIFGYVARSQLKRNPQNGGGMAIAGIVLGWVGIAGLIAVIVLVVAVHNSNPTFNTLLP